MNEVCKKLSDVVVFCDEVDENVKKVLSEKVEKFSNRVIFEQYWYILSGCKCSYENIKKSWFASEKCMEFLKLVEDIKNGEKFEEGNPETINILAKILYTYRKINYLL